MNLNDTKKDQNVTNSQLLIDNITYYICMVFDRFVMKATYTLLPDFTTTIRPFVIREIVRPQFSSDFHFHDECQLVYVVSGKGKRIIGDSIESFEPGDMTFIGPNVPHVWYSNAPTADNPKPDISIALYVKPDLLEGGLKHLINTDNLKQFFIQAERGLVVVGEKKERITQLMKDMLGQNGIPLLSSVLQILSQLIDPDDIRWLSEPSILSAYATRNEGRVSKTISYIHQNFREEISLEEAASVAGMQLHSFCRFFKTLTSRTFTDFLNEVRIGFSCKLLQQSDLTITQIGFESGFSNISYFNRSFKKIKGQTPSEYRLERGGKGI